MNNENVYKFSGVISRCVYKSDDFSVYAVDVNKKDYPLIKRNKYNNVSITGELSDLSIGAEYEVTGVETDSKNGVSYKVLNIKRDIPTSKEDVYTFLTEILTPKQADTLYASYPNIIDIVKNNKTDEVDLNKLNGIGEKSFEKIKNKIIENFCLMDLVVEFGNYLTLNVIKKIYDKYTSIDVLKDKLKKEPYKCLCGLARVGFKSADSLLLNIEKASKENIKNGKKPIIDFGYDLKTSSNRCLACVLYLLQENEQNGNTKMNIIELRKQVINTVPECIDSFTDAIKDCDDIYYNKDTLDIALKKTYNTEKYIADTILKYVNDDSSVWNYDIEKYRNVGEFNLSDEQMGALDKLCKYKISILNGSGGTGKSASTQAIINMLKDNKKSFKLASPTGKAAKVQKEYTKEDATTVHRGLCYNPNPIFYKNGIISDNKNFDYVTYFEYNLCNKLLTDVLIIDEMSMCDVNLFSSILESIDFSKTKLLLIGDNCQIPSVGIGNLLHDFMESKIVPTTTLTKVHRYGDGGLMRVATDTRMCKQYLTKDMKNKATVFGNNKDYTFIDLQSEDITRNTVALYKKLLDNRYTVNDIQILTAKNVGECGSIAINNIIQRVANKNYGSESCLKYGETTYYKGDMVIQMKNDYRAVVYNDDDNSDFFEEENTVSVYNGDVGFIEKIEKNFMVVNFDGLKIKYSKDKLNTLNLSYSISIHRSQGSSIKVVILLTPKSHTFMLNSNLIYTGLTRMKEKCFHLGDINTVNICIKKKANIERHTFMQQLLIQNNIQ